MLLFNRRAISMTGNYCCAFIMMIVILCFHNDDSFSVPDRITAVASLAELNQQRKWNLIMV